MHKPKKPSAIIEKLLQKNLIAVCDCDDDRECIHSQQAFDKALLQFLDSHAMLFALSPSQLMTQGLIKDVADLKTEVATDEAKITELESKPGADVSKIEGDVAQLKTEVEGDAPTEVVPPVVEPTPPVDTVTAQ